MRLILSLVGFFSAAVLVCSAAVVLASPDEKKTVEGELIDMHCYSVGQATGDKHASCAQKCAESGIPMGVLVDGKGWTLATNPKPLAQYAAKTVRVTGALNPETMIIAPDKVEVNDGGNWTEVKLEDEHHKG
jgi:hypothetical protein